MAIQGVEMIKGCDSDEKTPECNDGGSRTGGTKASDPKRRSLTPKTPGDRHRFEAKKGSSTGQAGF